MTDSNQPDSPAPATPPRETGERMVLVGRRYSGLSNSWNEWDKPFDEVVDAVTERAADRKASGHPDEIVEVVVVRRARVMAEITVERSDG